MQRPGRHEERDVEDPGAVLLGILERDPLVEVVRNHVLSHPGTIRVRPSQGGERYRPDVTAPTAARPALVAELRGRPRSAAGAHRGHRTQPLPARRLQHGGRDLGRGLPDLDGGGAGAACVAARTPRCAFRRPRFGHRAGRRRGARSHDAVVIVTTKMNRLLGVDLDARQAWVEPGDAQPRPEPVSWPRMASTTPLTPRASRAARSAATSPPTPADPHCLSEGVTAHAHPGRRGRAARRLRRRARAARTPSPPGSTCGACSSAARGCSVSPPGSSCDSRRTRRRSARCCSTSSGSRTAPPRSARSSPPAWCRRRSR